MNYRALEPNEYNRLEFIFKPRGLPLPDPLIERVAVAEDDGRIVGMAILRYLPLVDALWADKHHRGGVIDYPQLVAKAEEPLYKLPGSRAYAIGTGTHVNQIAESCGYRKLETVQLMEKEF